MTVPRRSFLAAAATFVAGACSGLRHRPAAERRPAGPGTSASTASTTTPSPPTSAATGGPARFVQHGPASAAEVAFTFHGSGDPALLHDLLGAAATANVPLTIFAVGNWLDANAGLAKTILSGGHELANHTYTHPVLPRLGRQQMATEIVGCRDALTRATGSPGRWFRPSGTPTPTPAILQEAGRAGYTTVVGYDVDPLDYQDPGADAIVHAVRAGLHPGAIVSLHTGHRGTVTAFASMIAAARERGLRPVRVSDLLIRA